MGLPYQDVQRIKEEFVRRYYLVEPYLDYVRMCGISKVGLWDNAVSPDEKDDLCFVVGLLKQLPSALALPQEYEGVKVFVTVVGELHLMAQEVYAAFQDEIGEPA